jgi:hypothetical protein
MRLCCEKILWWMVYTGLAHQVCKAVVVSHLVLCSQAEMAPMFAFY